MAPYVIAFPELRIARRTALPSTDKGAFFKRSKNAGRGSVVVVK